MIVPKNLIVPVLTKHFANQIEFVSCVLLCFYTLTSNPSTIQKTQKRRRLKHLTSDVTLLAGIENVVEAKGGSGVGVKLEQEGQEG